MEFNRYDFQCTRVCLLALIGDKFDRDAIASQIHGKRKVFRVFSFRLDSALIRLFHCLDPNTQIRRTIAPCFSGELKW